MADQIVPPATEKALIAVAENGGPAEISALTTELNRLSQPQLQAAFESISQINQTERQFNPGLPPLEVSVGGGGNSLGDSGEDYKISRINSLGNHVEVYHREFEHNHTGIDYDKKFDLLTHNLNAIDVTGPNKSSVHIDIPPPVYE